MMLAAGGLIVCVKASVKNAHLKMHNVDKFSGVLHVLSLS